MLAPSIDEISEYALELLRESPEFALYRGRRPGSTSAVLIASPVSRPTDPASLGRLQNEYALAPYLDSDWAIKPLALVQDRARPMLLLEDFAGGPLDRSVQPPGLGPRLRIAVHLASAVSRLHTRGLIHKDLHPANILVDASAGVRLTGFGIATRAPRERQPPVPLELLPASLAYMAPEQTGRMNRSIDSRTDLYSLGIVLYELFTGLLPFQADDAPGWVHCHIARQPRPPEERDIPGQVSRILLKLLAKLAEDRYQTAAGLEADLRRCLAEWESKGRMDPFVPGEHDFSGRLQIAEKLYGREHEVEALRAAFERTAQSGAPELVLVTGNSGIGKSSIVAELQKSLGRGHFATGKFDQYKRDIPYATMALTLRPLVRQILAAGESEAVHWREALRAAMGPNGQLMVDLIPELELVLGKQPPVLDLPAQEAQNRFRDVFRQFLSVLARPKHPLALFFDDAQWMDAATVELLQFLMAGQQVHHLLLILAYRDHEVDPSHPVGRAVEAIRNAEAAVQEIVLAPLALADLTHLIADALHCRPEHAEQLAGLVEQKTAGNPFFAIQFLTALADEGLLSFDRQARAWIWDLACIRAKGYSENVVDLMAARLHRLPPETQRALKLFACLGNISAFSVLAAVGGQSAEELHAALWQAVHAGIVLRQDDTYTFLHDRVQEAAYRLIPEPERPAGHLEIGRKLQSLTAPEELEGKVFELVNHLNRGAALIDSPAEREQLAELNLVAGKRAKASTAYAPALTYFAAGRNLLPENRWERLYRLTFELELHRFECEFLTADREAAEQRLAVLSQRAAGPAALLAAEIARIEGRELEAERLYEQAIHSARQHGFLQHEALANELAGRFYAGRGFALIAQAYLRQARHCYVRWGAAGKAKQLDRLYPGLQDEAASPSPAAMIGQIDLATVIRASQALSSEILLDKLMENLLRMTVEHAGADRAVLILHRDGESRLEAEALAAPDGIRVTLRQSAASSAELPVSALQYLIRTLEPVRLEDAAVKEVFSVDEYMRQRRPKSVLLLPIVKQGKLVGALYLENRLVPHVFTSARISVLELFASQAAISLENALLYADLRRSEAFLAEGQRISHTGNWSWNAATGKLVWSEESYRIYGFDPAEAAPSLELFLTRVAEDDRLRIQQSWAHVIREKQAASLEFRMIFPDGSTKYLSSTTHPIVNANGDLVEMDGTVMDITGQHLSNAALERAFEEIKLLQDQLYKENLALRDEVDRASMFEEIVGSSPALQAVLSRIAKVAPTDATVLITGETGTGKELIARAVHKRSHRSGRAFVSVNCAALSPSLISSELFGHEKGAFTGAIQRRLGRFELADGGTIFLDEVGELPPDVQVALLRVLQEREFERVGGTQSIKLDVRVIAASNRDLKAAAGSGAFRSDLYYRLNVFPIEVPPLRERREDISMLLEYFVRRYAGRAGKNIRKIEQRTLELLRSYDWPGNIRELQNVIERSIVLCSDDTFSVDEAWLFKDSEHVPHPPSPLAPGPSSQSERQIIEAALAESRGRVAGPSGAAARLRVPPSTLESRIKALKIQKSRFKFS